MNSDNEDIAEMLLVAFDGAESCMARIVASDAHSPVEDEEEVRRIMDR